MKHRDWLRLQSEGEEICVVLRQKGYQCRKQVRRLSWNLIKDGNCYMLTWLPAPVGDWSLIPQDTSLARKELWAIVQRAINGKPEESVTDQLTGDSNRPWAIARLLPDAQRYIVARFHNRQDAHDHLRFLNRFTSGAEFEIVFDVPISTEPDN